LQYVHISIPNDCHVLQVPYRYLKNAEDASKMASVVIAVSGVGVPHNLERASMYGFCIPRLI